jgi:flagellar biosynthesis protein FlhF
MHVKTFVGLNPQAVLSRIKMELGAEAVILSSQDTVRDGVRVHEVVAGVDRDPGAVVPAAFAGAARAEAAYAGQAAAQPGAAAPMPSGWSEWHKDWTRVKEHIYALMRPSIQWNRLSPRQRVALEFLQREGLDDDLVFDIFRRLVAGKDVSVLEVLGQIVPVRPWNDANWKEAIHIVSGPFGAGKTTTLIRMALLLKRDLPDLRVAVINADAARGTGRLVLRHWAELSDFMHLEVRGAQEMRRALRAAAAADVIFVDTPGLSGQARLEQSLADFGLSRLGAASHLVLPPYFAPGQMKIMIERYRSGLTSGSVIWTKLDEATNYAAILNAAVQLNLPVSALSCGPVLRGSLVAAAHSRLWKLLFKQQLPVDTEHTE